MELKQLNKIIGLVAFVISINFFSQMKMADIEGKQFFVNSTMEKRNLIEILDNSNYTVYYILDRRDFDLKKGLGTNGISKIIFFSKKYNKSILVNFEQMTYHVKKNVYKISLRTGSHDKYMFVSSMAILDNNFNYEYFMKYYYMPSPPPSKEGNKASWITLQDTKNYCNQIRIDLKGNVIYENIDDILSNISKISKDKKIKDCDCIIYDIDIDEYFPKKIIR